MLRHFSLAALAACVVTRAEAAQSTFTLNPSITITATCVVTAGSLSFGSMPNVASTVNASGAFSLTCTPSVHYNIGLDAGQNGASVTTRRMRVGATALYLDYSLFLDSARSTNWALASPNVVSGNGSGLSQTYTVYGALPAQATAGNGAYTDTVQIIVNY